MSMGELALQSSNGDGGFMGGVVKGFTDEMGVIVKAGNNVLEGGTNVIKGAGRGALDLEKLLSNMGPIIILGGGLMVVLTILK